MREIPGTLSETLIVVHFGPSVAAIVGAVEAAGVLRFRKRVYAVGIAARHRNSDSSHDAGRQALAVEMLPGGAAIH